MISYRNVLQTELWISLFKWIMSQLSIVFVAEEIKFFFVSPFSFLKLIILFPTRNDHLHKNGKVVERQIKCVCSYVTNVILSTPLYAKRFHNGKRMKVYLVCLFVWSNCYSIHPCLPSLVEILGFGWNIKPSYDPHHTESV